MKKVAISHEAEDPKGDLQFVRKVIKSQEIYLALVKRMQSSTKKIQEEFKKNLSELQAHDATYEKFLREEPKGWTEVPIDVFDDEVSDAKGWIMDAYNNLHNLIYTLELWQKSLEQNTSELKAVK